MAERIHQDSICSQSDEAKMSSEELIKCSICKKYDKGYLYFTHGETVDNEGNVTAKFTNINHPKINLHMKKISGYLWLPSWIMKVMSEEEKPSSFIINPDFEIRTVYEDEMDAVLDMITHIAKRCMENFQCKNFCINCANISEVEYGYMKYVLNGIKEGRIVFDQTSNKLARCMLCNEEFEATRITAHLSECPKSGEDDNSEDSNSGDIFKFENKTLNKLKAKCMICNKEVGATRFAAHLSGCMGLNERRKKH